MVFSFQSVQLKGYLTYHFLEFTETMLHQPRLFSLSDFKPWWHFGFALVIGVLIGLEREFYQQKEDVLDFAGIQTFSLIA